MTGRTGPGWSLPEDRLAAFLRGLVVGAFLGALVAGSAALRRVLGCC